MMMIPLLLAAAPIPAIHDFSRIAQIERVADGRRGLWIADERGRWFYARFIDPCRRLSDTTGVKFDLSPIDRLDKNSAVIADGERCRFATFERSDPPPKRR